MTVWFTARGAGLAALVLLTVSTSLGALITGRGRPSTRLVLQYVHRATAGLGLGVLVLHVGTILADSYAHVGAVGAVVPFTSGYRATWVGLGTIAAYLLLVVAVVGLARGRIAGSPRGAAGWRSLHVLAYPAWALAMLHGYMSGTDAHQRWVLLLFAGCAIAVLSSLAARLASAAEPEVTPRRPAGPVPVARGGLR